MLLNDLFWWAYIKTNSWRPKSNSAKNEEAVEKHQIVHADDQIYHQSGQVEPTS